MSKYILNLSFETDISEDQEDEITEEEMVDILKNLFEEEKHELLGYLEYELADCNKQYKITFNSKEQSQKIL